jgi:hippurate hydrolase
MDDRILEAKVIEFKNYLHRIPELDKELPKTREYLISYLEKLPCEIVDIGGDGFAAFFEGTAGQGNSPTLAFRSDMDALPIEEVIDTPYKSIHSGVMHACGHDGHMSILLGLASWLSENKGDVKANVLLVFQAAEETTGGAMGITESGILKDYSVDSIFGLHLWPGYPLGTIICREKEFMAGTFVLEIEISGRSVHIADWRQGVDALEAGAAFIERAYELETRLPDEIFRLLRFGKMTAGTGNNVVAERAFIEGAVRAYDDATFDFFFDGLEAIAQDLEAEKRCKIIMCRSMGYPPVINPSPLYERTKKTLRAAGFEWFEPNAPMMQAEDFSYYQTAVPGIFLHLGTGLEGKLHSNDYAIDDAVLMKGVKLFREIVNSYE